jgi:hypothetical protein
MLLQRAEGRIEIRPSTLTATNFDAESSFDNSAYKRWLWNNMQQLYI